MDDRFTICNMAIEAGGKSGIIALDDTTDELRGGPRRAQPRGRRVLASDPDAEYARVYRDRRRRRSPPTVAFPHLPSNTTAGGRGAATSRSTRSSSAAAPTAASRTCASRPSILRGPQGARGRARCIVIPATQAIWTQAMHEGLFDIFLDAERRGLARRPAGRAWAATWASWPRGSAPSRRPTATSSAAWATRPARSTWPRPPWPRRPPSPGTSRTPDDGRREEGGTMMLRREPSTRTAATSTPTSSSRRATSTPPTPRSWRSTAWRTSTRTSSARCSRATSSWRRRTSAAALPRARAHRDQGRRRLLRHRQELRPHLLPQRHQHRPADPRVPGGGDRGARGTGCESTSTPAGREPDAGQAVQGRALPAVHAGAHRPRAG